MFWSSGSQVYYYGERSFLEGCLDVITALTSLDAFELFSIGKPWIPRGAGGKPWTPTTPYPYDCSCFCVWFAWHENK